MPGWGLKWETAETSSHTPRYCGRDLPSPHSWEVGEEMSPAFLTPSSEVERPTVNRGVAGSIPAGSAMSPEPFGSIGRENPRKPRRPPQLFVVNGRHQFWGVAQSG